MFPHQMLSEISPPNPDPERLAFLQCAEELKKLAKEAKLYDEIIKEEDEEIDEKKGEVTGKEKEAKLDLAVTEQHEHALDLPPWWNDPSKKKNNRWLAFRKKKPSTLYCPDLHQRTALFKFYNKADEFIQRAEKIAYVDQSPDIHEAMQIAKSIHKKSVLNQLGICFQFGIGTTRSEKDALIKYDEAAKEDSAAKKESSAIAANNSAMIRLVNSTRIKNASEIKRAFEDIKKLHERVGITPPLSVITYNYAIILEFGINHVIEKDEKTALNLYVEGAKKEDCVAQTILGYCYDYGELTGVDKFRAFSYYEKAAKIGSYSIAFGNVGYCYANGEGVEQNNKKAIFWFKKAIKEGREFRRAVASVYRKSVPPNLDLAIQYEEAAITEGESTHEAMLQLVVKDYPARISSARTLEEKKYLEERFQRNKNNFLRRIARVDDASYKGKIHLNDTTHFLRLSILSFPDTFPFYQKLQELDIGYTGKIKPEEMNKLYEALEHAPRPLQSLSIRSNQDVKDILPAIKHRPRFCLSLDGDILKSDRAMQLFFNSHPFESSYSKQLMILKLSYANWTVGDAPTFMSWSNSISSLVILDLQNSTFENPTCACLLLYGITESFDLQSLFLSSCHLPAAAIRALPALVQRNKTLQVLDVSNNPVESEHFAPLIVALGENLHLVSLNLSNCNLSTSIQQALFRALGHHEKIKELFLHGNHIVPDAFLLAEKLEPLEKLYVNGGNPDHLPQLLQKNPNLKSLMFETTPHEKKEEKCGCSSSIIRALLQPGIELRAYHEIVKCRKREFHGELFAALKQNRSLTEFNLGKEEKKNEFLMRNQDQHARRELNWGKVCIVMACAHAGLEMLHLVRSIYNLLPMMSEQANHSHYRELSLDDFTKTRFFRAHVPHGKNKRRLENASACAFKLQ